MWYNYKICEIESKLTKSQKQLASIDFGIRLEHVRTLEDCRKFTGKGI